MSSKRVLVTGVAGFIGSQVAELLLKRGNEVVGIDNFDPFYDREIKERNLNKLQHYESFLFVEGDIRLKEDLLNINGSVDVVVHLAAKAGVLPSIKDPDSYVETNIQGTLNILEWMKHHEVKKLVFASSSSIYGNHPHIPYHEDLSVDNPISPYAFTKKSCELMNYTYHHLYEFDVLNLRLFTVYGPGQRPDLAIHKFFKLITDGKEIPIYGDGSTSRDYTYVEDTAEGIYKAIEFVTSKSRVYEIINLGNNSPVKLLDLIRAIGEVMGIEPQLKYLPMQPGDVNITYADISKASKLLDYNPQTSLKVGLTKFKEWFSQETASIKV